MKIQAKGVDEDAFVAAPASTAFSRMVQLSILSWKAARAIGEWAMAARSRPPAAGASGEWLPAVRASERGPRGCNSQPAQVF